MRIKNTLEMRGMQREELVNYFKELGGEAIGDGIFAHINWEVHVHNQIYCNLGSFVIPSTKITFSIEENYYEEMLSKFRFKFMRAGG